MGGMQGPGASIKAIKGSAAKGMILPFEPMALTFNKISYFVPFPKVTPAHFVSSLDARATEYASEHVCIHIQHIIWQEKRTGASVHLQEPGLEQ